jgi:predicted phage terminase large subunit-like protein
MNAPFARNKLEKFGRLLDEYKRRRAKHEQSQRGWYDEDGVRQGGLIAFVRYFWSVLEPENPFVDGWPLAAICEHLEAVTFGEINRLLINVPPGFAKSILTDVYWPAWEWGPMKKTHYRYIAFSYSASLTERDNDRFRLLIASDEYQRLYGPMKTKTKTEEMPFEERDEAGQVTLRNKTTIKVINTHTGWKLASSVGGVATGERGDRCIIDDPHSVQEAESEVVRKETVRWFRESISSRFNNLKTGAMVVIMQRVHEQDISGVILGDELDYCHLMIPWEFDARRVMDDDGRPIPTAIGWMDPRFELDDDGDVVCDEKGNIVGDGEPAWEDRFDEDSVIRLKKELGPFGWASQYQQSPVPRGGGIFKQDWWQVWDSPDGKFPLFDMVIASLDGAYTEKEENDPCALTVWGVWSKPGFTAGEIDQTTGVLWEAHGVPQQKLMLVHAWRKHLQFSAPRMDRLTEETMVDNIRWLPDAVVPGMSAEEITRRNARYARRTQPKWGLIEWTLHTCIQFKVDVLLIEAKASGISAAQELANRFGPQRFGIQLCPVKGDKVARALAVVPTSTQGLVYAPIRDWSDMVIDEMKSFPRGQYKDLTDSTTQALKYLRDAGLAQTDDEAVAEQREGGMHRSPLKALYPV